MIDHPQYAMWKAKLDAEIAQQELLRVERQRSFDATMAFHRSRIDYWTRIQEAMDARERAWLAWKAETVPWWDLVGRIGRFWSRHP